MATMLDQRPHATMPLGYGYTTITPEFRNPWAPSTSLNNAQALYQSSALPSTSSIPPQHQEQHQTLRDDTINVSYQSVDSLQQQQARALYGNDFASSATYAPTNNIRYSPEQYQSGSSYNLYDQHVQRRPSYPPKVTAITRDNYSAALDASEGMLAMSQDITPRNAYPPRNGSSDAYGFPVAHSTHSSMSSASGYPNYYHNSYNSSVDGSIAGSSVTDYGSEAESAMVARSMSNAGHMGVNFHQEQASMMTQFNSKMSASAQKKHKCKVCEKRFTRPSSLQTHMYSHTGEKPFACDFDGCGRHFSVVSNLRRHKKCHRNSTDRASSDEDVTRHSSE